MSHHYNLNLVAKLLLICGGRWEEEKICKLCLIVIIVVVTSKDSLVGCAWNMLNHIIRNKGYLLMDHENMEPVLATSYSYFFLCLFFLFPLRYGKFNFSTLPVIDCYLLICYIMWWLTWQSGQVYEVYEEVGVFFARSLIIESFFNLL